MSRSSIIQLSDLRLNEQVLVKENVIIIKVCFCGNWTASPLDGVIRLDQASIFSHAVKSRLFVLQQIVRRREFGDCSFIEHNDLV